jgi:hypothetical protein
MNLKAALAGAAVIAAVLLPGASHASDVTGTIKYACLAPSLTVRGVTPQGVCGFLITPVPEGDHFTLTPSKPADLDIAFYDASNNLLQSYAGPGPFGTGCHGFSNYAGAGAVKAVVVATPSSCVHEPGWSFQGSEYNISFTYTSL